MNPENRISGGMDVCARAGASPRNLCAALWIFLSLFAGLAGRAAGQAPATYFTTTPLPEGRQMYGAAVLGNSLYVIGGNWARDGYTANCCRAPILPDGSLGAWTETTPMPQPRSYIGNATLALNDMIYVVGGFLNDETKFSYNTAIWSRPGPDGNLGPWQESPPFAAAGRDCLTVVSTPGFIHVLGGSVGSRNPTAEVITGVVDAEGRIAAWEPGPPMPVQLWFHHAAALAGRVWVWGGLTGAQPNTASNRVYSASILGTGRIGEWREESQRLPMPIYAASNATAGPFLMTFCPRDINGTPGNDIWVATVGAEGLSPWMRLTSELPCKLYNSAATDYRRGVVYLPGGRLSHDVHQLDPTVYLFRLSAQAREQSEVAAAPPGAAPGAAATPAAQSTAMAVSSSMMATTGQGADSYTFQTAGRLAQEAAPGFLTYAQAKAAAAQAPPRPLILYFHSAMAKPCKLQEEILKSPQFQAVAAQGAFAWVDIRENPQLAQQMGVFRVPAWIFYDVRGAERYRFSQVLSLDALASAPALLR